MMAAPYRPAIVARESLTRFMAEIAAENEATLLRNTPRGPAVRKKQKWRDWTVGLKALVGVTTAMDEAA